MADNEELIWVDKEFAKRYNEIKTDKSKRDEQVKVLNDYIETIKESSKKEFKANLESLEEDVAIYTGLMLKVKQAFNKAKDEQLLASYELWEKFDKEIPSIKAKTEKITQELKPLQHAVNELDELFSKVNAYQLKGVVDTIKELGNLYGTQKQMIDFLVANFKVKEQ